MPNIIPFTFGSTEIRSIVDEHGEPWFVAADVAKVLGYRHTPSMVRMLGDGEAAVHIVHSRSNVGGKGTHTLHSRSKTGVEQRREMTIINESGLYACILKSRRPDAEQFRRWVTGEVLPQIRKQGFYADLDQRLTKRTPEEIGRGLKALADEVRRSLPRFTSNTSAVTDECVFVHRSAGQRASLDGTRDEVAYHRAMDRRGLPGITVDESTPISVAFDWHAINKADDVVIDRLYDALATHCRTYRGRPFSDKDNRGGFEVVSGLRSAQDARDLAGKLAKASRCVLEA